MSNQADGVNICQFIDNLDCGHKVFLLLGGLCLPFDNVTNTLIKRFIAAAIGRIHKLRRERLRELEAPWITKRLPLYKQFFYHYVVECLSFVTCIDFKID